MRHRRSRGPILFCIPVHQSAQRKKGSYLTRFPFCVLINPWPIKPLKQEVKLDNSNAIHHFKSTTDLVKGGQPL
jgi:hypothetical protein